MQGKKFRENLVGIVENNVNYKNKQSGYYDSQNFYMRLKFSLIFPPKICGEYT